MTIRFDRPVSRAARLSRRVGAFSFVLCLAVLLAHRFGPLETPYLVLLLLVSAGFAALASVLAVLGLNRLWMVGAVGGIDAFKALVYATLPLAIFAFGAVRYVVRPTIYDVSTDLTDAPSWLAPPHADQIWLTHDPNIGPENREAQSAAYPGLTGRRYDGAIDRVLEAVRKVAAENRITIVKTEGADERGRDLEDVPAKPQPNDGTVPDAPPDVVPIPEPRPYQDAVADMIRRSTDATLQGQTRTLVLGLEFDIIIRLREEAETTLVDVRVASRYGPHDLGFSAEIAENYLKALDAELLGIAGG